MRDRLSQPPHQALVEHVFAPALEQDAADNFENLMRVNTVQVLLLERSGDVVREHARELLSLFDKMQRDGASALELDPNLEDLYFNTERHVTRQLGPEIGGRMHTGRSRNDLNATTARMGIRATVLDLADNALDLRASLLGQASRHAETVMTGYTHLQPAQPITFGFYLSAVADALERDTARLLISYERINQSPLGAGALAGTGFALDRDRAAKLLGFSGIVENALDAVASRDYALEVMAALAILTITISRLAHDLYVWASYESGMVELADEVSLVSSIMPQKKNAITLEHCKAKAAQVIGALVAAMAATKGVPMTNVRDVNREAMHPIREAVREAAAAMQLMRITVDTLSVRSDHMLHQAQANFSTVTELADLLVREGGLPFRSAHRVVAMVVSDAIAANRSASEIDIDAVQRAAQSVTGTSVPVDGDALRAALDATLSVGRKRTSGSTNPNEVRRMVERALRMVERDRETIAASRHRVAQADMDLEAEVAEVLVGG